MRIFTRKKASKKASLSLSMEAIVILILAITMLGLGLAFVRNMFSNISGRASTAIDVADLSARPTENEPVVFSPNNPEVRIRDQINVQAGFYNPSIGATQWLMQVIDETGEKCGGLTATGPDDNCYSFIKTIYNDRPFRLEKDQTIGWNIVFDPIQVNDLDNIFPGATRAILLTVQFCEAETTGETPTATCKTNGEIFQRELFMTVRK